MSRMPLPNLLRPSFRRMIALSLLLFLLAGTGLFFNKAVFTHAASPSHALQLKAAQRAFSTSSDKPHSSGIYRTQPGGTVTVNLYYPTCDASCGNETWYANTTLPSINDYFTPAVTTSNNITTWTLQTSVLSTPLGKYTVTIGATSDAGANLGSLTLTINMVGPLNVPYVSQFQNQPTQGEDCGPTSVDMILQYFGLAPVGTDAQQITAIRNETGQTNPNKGTNSSQLENALTFFQVPYVSIPNSGLTAAQAVQEIQTSVNNGQPVIVLVDATKLGRTYHGHWIVVTGFSNDGKWARVNDPDSLSLNMKTPGPFDLGVSLLENAMAAGVNLDNNYAIAV